MAVKKLDQVPDDLKVLVAEENGETIIIGDSALLLMPLTVEELEGVTEELAKIADMMFDEEGNSLAMSYVIKKVLASGAIKKLLGKIIAPLPTSIISNVTIPQLRHILGVLWKQNLSGESVGEKVRKNFDAMLEWMGLNAPTSEIPGLLSTTSSPSVMGGQKITSEDDGSSGV